MHSLHTPLGIAAFVCVCTAYLVAMFWCCCNSGTEIARDDHSIDSEIILRDGQLPGRSTAGVEDLPTLLRRQGEPKEEEEQAKLGIRTRRGSKQAASRAVARAQEEEQQALEEEEEAEESPFDVTLEMTPGERLGALLDILDMKTLRVVELRREGRLRIHNLRAKANKKVKPGYFIVGVNGISGSAQTMVDEMRRSRTWKLQVARNHDFMVTLEKAGPLRLDLQFEKDSDCIVIRKVGEIGVVKEYNESMSSDAEKQIKPGDRILDVNGTAGPAKVLLETIRNSTELNLKIGRALTKPAQ